MPMHRQFVACRFRPNDRRAFTYHNDGEPVEVGDVVKVPDRSGDGWQRVTVSAIMDAEPDFPTKPILGKVDPDQLDMLSDGHATNEGTDA